MKSTTLFSVALFLTASTFAQSQSIEATPRKWAAEFNVLWPIVPGNLARAQLVRTLWQKGNLKGDLLVGANVNFPQFRLTEGRFSDYSLVMGYRQYIYKGLHLEYNQQVGLGKLNQHVTTNRDYNSFDWGVQLLVGYTVNIPRSRFYTALQLGAGSTVYQSNSWPIYSDNSLQTEVGNELLFVGGIQLGYRF